MSNKCEWRENDPWGPMPDTFDGTCGICYTINNFDEVEGRSLKTAEMNYCPKCGGKIKQIPFPKSEDEDE